MQQRRTWIFLLVCAVLAIALVVPLARDNQPTYQGRTLSKWLDLYRGVQTVEDGHYYAEATQAVRTIGTNALPFLVQWMRHEPPFWRTTARAIFPQAISESALGRTLFDGPGSARRLDAIIGFAILGTNAAPAIPGLKALMMDTNHSTTARMAIMALSKLGTPAFPHLVAALSDTNYAYRKEVAVMLAAFTVEDVGVDVCLPPLMVVRNDPDAQVRNAATNAIRKIAPQMLTNAPPR